MSVAGPVSCPARERDDDAWVSFSFGVKILGQQNSGPPRRTARVATKSLSIQVDEYNKDKKFSPNITSPVPELTNTQDGSIGLLHKLLVVVRIRMELEVSSHFFCSDLFLLQLVSFTVHSDPL